MSESVSQTIRKALAGHMARTARARRSRRCFHVKSDGVRCGSPALRGGPFCYFHDRMVNGMPAPCFPPLEDANAVQCAIMQVLESLAAGKMDVHVANTMLYGLQTAAANLKGVRFEPYPPSVVRTLPMDNASANAAPAATKDTAKDAAAAHSRPPAPVEPSPEAAA